MRDSICIGIHRMPIKVRLGPAVSGNVPIAVPDKIFGLTHFLDFIDRCYSLTSRYLPLAVLGSLPTGLLHICFPVSHSITKPPPYSGDGVVGASDLTRTGDLLITSEMHYRLCYTSIFCHVIISVFPGNVNMYFPVRVVEKMAGYHTLCIFMQII